MLSNTKYERDFGSYFYEFCLSMKIVLGLPKDLKEKWGTKYRSLFFILGINLLIKVFIYGYYSINKDCPLFCLLFFFVFVVLVFGHFVLFCMLCFFFFPVRFIFHQNAAVLVSLLLSSDHMVMNIWRSCLFQDRGNDLKFQKRGSAISFFTNVCPHTVYCYAKINGDRD